MLFHGVQAGGLQNVGGIAFHHQRRHGVGLAEQVFDRVQHGVERDVFGRSVVEVEHQSFEVLHGNLRSQLGEQARVGVAVLKGEDVAELRRAAVGLGVRNRGVGTAVEGRQGLLGCGEVDSRAGAVVHQMDDVVARARLDPAVQAGGQQPGGDQEDLIVAVARIDQAALENRGPGSERIGCGHSGNGIVAVAGVDAAAPECLGVAVEVGMRVHRNDVVAAIQVDLGEVVEPNGGAVAVGRGFDGYDILLGRVGPAADLAVVEAISRAVDSRGRDGNLVVSAFEVEQAGLHGGGRTGAAGPSTYKDRVGVFAAGENAGEAISVSCRGRGGKVHGVVAVPNIHGAGADGIDFAPAVALGFNGDVVPAGAARENPQICPPGVAFAGMGRNKSSVVAVAQEHLAAVYADSLAGAGDGGEGHAVVAAPGDDLRLGVQNGGSAALGFGLNGDGVVAVAGIHRAEVVECIGNACAAGLRRNGEVVVAVAAAYNAVARHGIGLACGGLRPHGDRVFAVLDVDAAAAYCPGKTSAAGFHQHGDDVAVFAAHNFTVHAGSLTARRLRDHGDLVFAVPDIDAGETHGLRHTGTAAFGRNVDLVGVFSAGDPGGVQGLGATGGGQGGDVEEIGPVLHIDGDVPGSDGASPADGIGDDHKAVRAGAGGHGSEFRRVLKGFIAAGNGRAAQADGFAAPGLRLDVQGVVAFPHVDCAADHAYGGTGRAEA